MSNVAVIPQSNALAMREDEVLPILKSSLYPGAEDGSIKLVLGYCKAAGLDPMQKPVHIVPMRVKTGVDAKGKPVYAMRDVIMPGVGLYRTQAARSGQFMGISEPEFGPMVELEYEKDVWRDGERSTVKRTMEYPEWCKVTVKRVVGSMVADFTATEYWIENYATAGKDKDGPNEMWVKRPRGQLAKCAQAQALRMAFPEMTGAAPTADEMEGKTIDEDGVVEHVAKPPVATPQRKSATIEKPADPRKMPHVEHADQGEAPPIEPAGTVVDADIKPDPEPSGVLATAGELAYIRRKFTEAGLDLAAVCDERQWQADVLTKNQFATLKSLAIDTISQKV